MKNAMAGLALLFLTGGVLSGQSGSGAILSTAEIVKSYLSSYGMGVSSIGVGGGHYSAIDESLYNQDTPQYERVAGVTGDEEFADLPIEFLTLLYANLPAVREGGFVQNAAYVDEHLSGEQGLDNLAYIWFREAAERTDVDKSERDNIGIDILLQAYNRRNPRNTRTYEDVRAVVYNRIEREIMAAAMTQPALRDMSEASRRTTMQPLIDYYLDPGDDNFRLLKRHVMRETDTTTGAALLDTIALLSLALEGRVGAIIRSRP